MRKGRFVWLTIGLVVGCRAPYSRDLDTLKARQARADIRAAAEAVPAIHAEAFHHASKEEFDRAVERAQSQVRDKMKRRELELVLKEMLAVVGDDHTAVTENIYGDFLRSGGRTLPVKLAYLGDGRARVTTVARESASGNLHVGAVVTAIDGVGIGEWVARYRKYVSQEDSQQRDAQAIGDLPELLWFERGEVDVFELRGAASDGREWVERVRAAREDGKWIEENPTAGEDRAFPFAFYRGGDVCVMTARSFFVDLIPEWEKSVNAMLGQMRQRGSKLLILDLRQNGGGDSGLGVALLQAVAQKPFSTGRKDWRYSRAYQLAILRWGIQRRGIPSWLWLEYFVSLDDYLPGGRPDRSQMKGEWFRTEGRVEPAKESDWRGTVAVVVDGRTYSAGVDVAAIVKDNGLGIVAGEETGGRATYYSEVATVILPNSGIICFVPSARRTRPGGFDDGRGVMPDVAVGPGASVEEVVRVVWDKVAGK